jgi:hypothetical protein
MPELPNVDWSGTIAGETVMVIHRSSRGKKDE